jgi:DNA-binding GntR family transcriptional regulator
MLPDADGRQMQPKDGARVAASDAIDELALLVQKMDDIRGTGWLEIHDEFHNAIFRLSGLPLLREWLPMLRDRMRPYRLIHLYDMKQRKEAQDDHHEYIAAFRKCDESDIAGIVRRHLKSSAIIGGYADPPSSTP